MGTVGVLSLEHFFFQAISLPQRKFHMLFHLDDPDVSGQRGAAMLRHDPVVIYMT